MKKNSNFQLYYNKVYLMKDTVVRDLHPSSDTFSLDIDYGTDYDYSFVLEDGSVRRARVNSLDSFFDITRIAAVCCKRSCSCLVLFGYFRKTNCCALR